MIPGPDQILACPRCDALHRRRTLATGNTLEMTRWSDGKVDAPMLPDLPKITRCHSCRRIFWLANARALGEIHPAYDPKVEYPPRCELTFVSAGPDREMSIRVLRYHGFDAALVLARAPVVLYDDVDLPGGRRFSEMLQHVGATTRLVQHPPPPPIPMAWVEAPHVSEIDEEGCFEALREGLAETRADEVHLRLRAWWKGNDPCRSGGLWRPFDHRSAEARENLNRLDTLFEEEQHPRERLLRAETRRELRRFEEAIAVLHQRAPKGLEHEVMEIVDRARRGQDWVFALPPSETDDDC